MTAKDKAMEEAHLSNNINAPSQAGSACEPELNIPSTEVARKQGHNWGWMLSWIIGLNIMMLGTAIISGSAFSNVQISVVELRVFLIILVLLTSIWIIYYVIYTARKEDAVVYKDDHAGPIWLRGGLVLFGVLSIIMDIFKIASYVGFLHCGSAIKVVFPVIQLLFIILQSYFFWVHSKDCVQLHTNITRCGLMLILSTNLVVWMTLVMEESNHQTSVPPVPTTDTNDTQRYVGKSYMRARYADQCQCSHSSCMLFQVAYYYLYPFNIEYSLFASAMAYVLWKNVGRVAEEHSHHKVKFSLRGIFLGPVAGVLLVVVGLATFIAYEMDIANNNTDADRRERALMMHFVMNIVIVTLMSISTVIGCAVYRVDHREHVSDKNPTRSLDVGLLVGASLGQFIISYFSIVAMIATGSKGHLNRLNLTWGILMVIQLGLQNYFIIEGLHREPYHEEHPPVTVVANPYVLQPNKELSIYEGSEKEPKSSSVFTVHNPFSHTDEHRPKLLWKRRVLKEVCVFLLLGNVILWIMPSFGARPQFDHDTEIKFYSFTMWAAIVNVGLPFGIFYRMHSVASLFEVFVTS